MVLKTFRACLLVALVLGCAIRAMPLALAASVDALGEAARAALASAPELAVDPATGEPAVGNVRRSGQVVGCYGSSYAHVNSVGYSGHPIDVLVVVGTDGRIMATRLLSQEEPILTIGVGPDALDSYVEGFAGTDVRQPVRILQRDGTIPDAVSGATISSGVIRDAVLRTGRLLLQGADTALAAPPAPDVLPTWDELVSSGQVAVRTIPFAEARAAMPDVASLPQGEGTFAEIAAATLDDANLAATLVGRQRFDRLATDFAADTRLVLVAARGVYSVKGTAWRRTGVFGRLAVVTPGGDMPLEADTHVRLPAVQAQGAPEFREIFVAALPPEAGRGPVELALVVDKTGEGASRVHRFTFAAGATVDGGSAGSEILDEPLWMQNWRDATPAIVVLSVMLAGLFAGLYVSGPVVRRPVVYEWLRNGFLVVTLVWLGWIAGAQLSVVQVVAFIQAMLTGFNWKIFLLAPLIFILWSFVALGVLFWGRGVYCGWLCPFGALQELLHKIGQRFGIPRIEVPWEVHERLWPFKYIALLVIIGLSLQDTTIAFKAAEIEPFKTAITLHFVRAWPFVAYVVALLAIGLFVERAFCRYMCPLGAALAIPSKFKIFDWLIRRPQCGRECRLCATTCTVQAIDPIGRINPNECIYCLKCQVNYHDPNTCVPLKMRARRRAEPGQGDTP